MFLNVRIHKQGGLKLFCFIPRECRNWSVNKKIVKVVSKVNVKIRKIWHNCNTKQILQQECKKYSNIKFNATKIRKKVENNRMKWTFWRGHFGATIWARGRFDELLTCT